MKEYNHSEIEKKWQKEWEKKEIYKTQDPAKSKNPKPKFYILDMFPYPSGEGLHVGHPKGYIATDVVSRMKRMQGFNVLHPMGFDAFGLPAENYAIKTKTNPMDSVAKNVARYKKQLEILGFDYDWSREVNTTDPKFYTWTQWIFLKLLEKGLAYESFEPINWCPSCKTGLANEDVEDGKCERCGTPVEKKPMRQWVLRITDYADRLLADLDKLDWPESIKESQRNWIGRSEGAELSFDISAACFRDKKSVTVFTTRPDTLFGVTYVVLAPEHGLVTELLKHKENLKNHAEVVKYVAHARVMTQIERTDAKKDKTGVRLEGVTATNPANGEKVPVYVADYVLAEYGTGAVMAVPAHDERDFAFAKKFNLPIRRVVEPKFIGTMGDGAAKPGLPFIRREAVCAIVRNPKNGTYLCNSWKGFRMNGLFTGGIEPGEDLVEGAKREVREETGYKNLKHVRTSDLAINTYFYHRVKKQNRHAHFKFVFFDLMDDERAPVDENESAVHEVVWKKKEELKDFFTVFEGSFVLNILDGDDYVHVEPGILSRSGAFDGMDSVDAMRKITDSVGGKWVVKYKLKDWVFSRQRYWGEPFPIVHSSDYADVVRAVTPKLEINFYKDAIWEAIINGAKKIETRVLNPDEPERFFGSVQPGDFISGANKTTGEKKIFKVKSIRSWKNIAELWADRSIHGITFSKPYASLDELRSGYADLAPAYAEKADKNGIAGWELEMVTVPLPVSDKDLPVELPKVKSYEPTGTGESPLAAIDKWVNVKVGKGKDAKILKRETNTMPQWAGSSWYYLRYMDPHNDKALVDAAKERYWNEVDFYVGGAEHATRHLIYARFWHKFLYDIGVVSTLEPFKRLQSVGLIMGEDGRKMSKRFGNVVNPDEIVNTYGADTLRVYEMFMGPFDQAIAWSTSSIVGSRRFVERVWRLAGAVSKDAKLAPEAEILLNKTIKKVSEGIAALRHNTAVSSLMILSNELERAEAVPRAAYETLLKLVAPFAPHVAEELWASLGNKGSIHVSAWPVADEGKLSGGSAKIVVQVNGKVRASFEAPLDADKASLEATALALDEVKKWVGDKKPTKVIVVPGKLVSIVARQ